MCCANQRKCGKCAYAVNRLRFDEAAGHPDPSACLRFIAFLWDRLKSFRHFQKIKIALGEPICSHQPSSVQLNSYQNRNQKTKMCSPSLPTLHAFLRKGFLCVVWVLCLYVIFVVFPPNWNGNCIQALMKIVSRYDQCIQLNNAWFDIFYYFLLFFNFICVL